MAGLDPGLPRARALLDIIRVVHEVGDGVDSELDARRSRLVAYLEALSAFEGARQPFSSGVTLASASDKRERKHLEAFADATGFSLERDGGTTTLVAESGERAELRRAALVRAGFDPVAAAAQLNRGESIAPALRADDVPLPLPNRAWQSRDADGAAERFQGTALAAILGDRRASLLYYGLCAMDGQTLAYLASKPSISAAIYNSNQVGTVALYGRSLRIRDGRVDVPGGAPAVPLWETIAGEPVSDPEKFFVSVLSRDGGRLALLYDAIAQLDGDAQAFALGLSIEDAGRPTGAVPRSLLRQRRVAGRLESAGASLLASALRSGARAGGDDRRERAARRWPLRHVGSGRRCSTATRSLRSPPRFSRTSIAMVPSMPPP